MDVGALAEDTAFASEKKHKSTRQIEGLILHRRTRIGPRRPVLGPLLDAVSAQNGRWKDRMSQSDLDAVDWGIPAIVPRGKGCVRAEAKMSGENWIDPRPTHIIAASKTT